MSIILGRIARTACIEVVYVCVLGTTVNSAKTAEPIEMSFAMKTRVGLRNHVLDWSPDSPKERDTFEGMASRSCRSLTFRLADDAGIFPTDDWLSGSDAISSQITLALSGPFCPISIFFLGNTESSHPPNCCKL